MNTPNPHRQARADAVNAAYDLATSAAEATNLDAASLDLLAAGLRVDQRIASGDLRPGQIHAEITTGIIEMYENVERGNPFWAAHLRITEAVLEALTPEERQKLWARTEWADVVDQRTPQALAPALSDLPTADQVDAGIDALPNAHMGAEAESDSDATEVVDAEVVEDVEGGRPCPGRPDHFCTAAVLRAAGNVRSACGHQSCTRAVDHRRSPPASDHRERRGCRVVVTTTI